MESKLNENVALLTLPKIASWQISRTPAKQDLQWVAELPALQRGAVWKSEQIENLWDSIIQGFPVGSFLLSPYDAELGKQRFKHATKDEFPYHPTHMLLDGQQRATGIALGFLSPWYSTPPEEDVKSVLWVDLATPPEGRDVDFVFRVTTRSHPWGYSRSNPAERISQQQIRDSIRAFKKASSPSFDESKPHEIPLHAVWPWDADAPIPVSILIESLTLNNGDIETSMKHARNTLDKLVFMNLPETDDGNPSKHLKHWKSQHDGVCVAFSDQSSYLHARLRNLLSTLNDRIGSKYLIPASVIPAHALNKTGNNNQETRSPVESLFIRINSAGTPLAGEELMYSLIKSAWIEAPTAVAKLTHRLATPARTALLASRVVRARHQRKRWMDHQEGVDGAKLRHPSTPSVDEFRRWMHGMNKDQPDFAKELQNYIQQDGLHVFEMAYKFLTEGSYGLPVVLANELAQKSQDVFFLLLTWLDRLSENNLDPLSEDAVNKNDRRRVIGFLTSLSWFSRADGKPRAVDSIWHDLQTIDSEKLPEFFNRSHFLKTMAIDNRGRQHMIPLVSPGTLETTLRKKILGHQGYSNTISGDESEIWTDWNWWSSLIDPGRPKDIDEELQKYFPTPNPPSDESASDRIRDSWRQFMEILHGNKSILIYAQRNWIGRWFPDFDPSLPEFIEDKNRPWDFDHIHPQNLLQGPNGGTLRGLPTILTYWHRSIGNLRAWPLEANRSDGDDSPSIKLKKATDEEKGYGIEDTNKLDASFIDGASFDMYWDKCTPDDGVQLNYESARNAQRALIKAIIWRFLAIYRKWYEDLKISTLS